MKKKPAGLLLAFLFAVIGTLLLVAYVQQAKNKAAADERTVAVVVATRSIPKGTDVEKLAGSVKIVQLPVSAKAAGALSTLKAMIGKRTTVDLVEGEQILYSRFATPEQSVDAAIGAGNVEVTISFPPERAVGGRVKPGDRVDVITSFAADKSADGTPTPDVTKILLPNVKVTAVQSTTAFAMPKDPKAPQDATTPSQNAGPTQAPLGALLVSLAVSPADAERLVYAKEFGTLYLAGNGKAETPGSKLVSKENVFK